MVAALAALDQTSRVDASPLFGRVLSENQRREEAACITLLNALPQFDVCEELVIADVGLSAIPISAYHLPNLIKLVLCKNSLTSMRSPAATASAQSLIEIDLSRNCFVKFPMELLEFKRLTTVNVSHNRIEAVELGLLPLQQWTTLDLSYNRIRILPSMITLQASLQGKAQIRLIGNSYKDSE